jgi:hypothetical protein
MNTEILKTQIESATNASNSSSSSAAVLGTELLLAKALFLSSSTRAEAFLSPKRHVSTFPICELPSVLLLSIIHYLDIPDFFRLVCTCKRLAAFQKNADLWKFLCIKSWKELRLPNLKTLPVPNTCDWKALARCFMVQVNLLADKSKFSGSGFSKTSTDVYFGQYEKGLCEGYGFRIYFQAPQPEEEQALALGENATEEERHAAEEERRRKQEEGVKFDVYEGQWAKDLPNGLGSKRWINGDTYAGYWKQGYTHGHGIYSWGIGDKYEGNYDEGKRNGDGTYFYADGSTYTGSWLNHKQHGFGKRKYLNGNSYEGEWCEGNLEGKGTFIWQDNSDYHGDMYTGSWRDNTEHGQGEYRSVFGTVYSGTYNMGTRQGNGSFFHADGYSWDGFWHNDIPCNLDNALHPKMRECIEAGKCTQSLTGKAPFYGQVLFRCLDCHGLEDPEKRRYVCQNCIEVCHKTHRIEKKIWTCGRSFCWCEHCQLKSDKGECSSDNSHSHNHNHGNCK